MAFPFQFGTVDDESAVDIGVTIASDADTWTWLESSRSRPIRLEPSEWPDGLAKSVDVRNDARNGAAKGRVLVVRHGPAFRRDQLAPVAVLCWHAHGGNWPLSVLDCGYRLDMDAEQGELLVVDTLLSALADLNDRPQLQDRKVARPTDRLGWAIRHQDGAGSDRAWGRAVATRAQEWGFEVVKPKSARPTWARKGFYGERPRR